MGPKRSIDWAAGLFEGEGCVTTNRTHGYAYPMLTMDMTDEDSLRDFAATVGVGNVIGPYDRGGNKPAWKPVWRWSICGTRAVGAAWALFPLLGERRQLRMLEVFADYPLIGAA